MSSFLRWARGKPNKSKSNSSNNNSRSGSPTSSSHSSASVPPPPPLTDAERIVLEQPEVQLVIQKWRELQSQRCDEAQVRILAAHIVPSLVALCPSADSTTFRLLFLRNPNEFQTLVKLVCRLLCVMASKAGSKQHPDAMSEEALDVLTFFGLLLRPQFYRLPSQADTCRYVAEITLHQNLVPRLLQVVESRIRDGTTACNERTVVVFITRALSCGYYASLHGSVLEHLLNTTPDVLEIPYKILCTACGAVSLPETVVQHLLDMTQRFVYSMITQSFAMKNGLPHIFTGLRLYTDTYRPPAAAAADTSPTHQTTTHSDFAPAVMAAIKLVCFCCTGVPSCSENMKMYHTYVHLENAFTILETWLVYDNISRLHDVVEALNSMVYVYPENAPEGLPRTVSSRFGSLLPNKHYNENHQNNNNNNPNFRQLAMNFFRKTMDSASGNSTPRASQHGESSTPPAMTDGPVSPSWTSSRVPAITRNAAKTINPDAWNCLCNTFLRSTTESAQTYLLQNIMGHILHATEMGTFLLLNTFQLFSSIVRMFHKLHIETQRLFLDLLFKLGSIDFLAKLLFSAATLAGPDQLSEDVICLALQHSMSLAQKNSGNSSQALPVVDVLRATVQLARRHISSSTSPEDCEWTARLGLCVEMFATIPLREAATDVVDCLIVMLSIPAATPYARRTLLVLSHSDLLRLIAMRSLESLLVNTRENIRNSHVTRGVLCFLIVCCVENVQAPGVLHASGVVEACVSLFSCMIPATQESANKDVSASYLSALREFVVSLLVCIISCIVHTDPAFLEGFASKYLDVVQQSLVSAVESSLLSPNVHTQTVLDIASLRRANPTHAKSLVQLQHAGEAEWQQQQLAGTRGPSGESVIPGEVVVEDALCIAAPSVPTFERALSLLLPGEVKSNRALHIVLVTWARIFSISEPCLVRSILTAVCEADLKEENKEKHELLVELLLHLNVTRAADISDIVKLVFHTPTLWKELLHQHHSSSRIVETISLGFNGSIAVSSIDTANTLCFDACLCTSQAFVESMPMGCQGEISVSSPPRTPMAYLGGATLATLFCPPSTSISVELVNGHLSVAGHRVCGVSTDMWYRICLRPHTATGPLHVQIISKQNNCVMYEGLAPPSSNNNNSSDVATNNSNGAKYHVILGRTGVENTLLHIHNVRIIQQKSGEGTHHVEETCRLRGHGVLANQENMTLHNLVAAAKRETSSLVRLHGQAFVPIAAHWRPLDVFVGCGFTRVLSETLRGVVTDGSPSESALTTNMMCYDAIRSLCLYSPFLLRERGFFGLLAAHCITQCSNDTTDTVTSIRAFLCSCISLSPTPGPLPLFESVLRHPALWSRELFVLLNAHCEQTDGQGLAQLVRVGWTDLVLHGVFEHTHARMDNEMCALIARHVLLCWQASDYSANVLSGIFSAVTTYGSTISAGTRCQHVVTFRNLLLRELCFSCLKHVGNAKFELAWSICAAPKWFYPFFQNTAHSVSTTLGTYLLCFTALRIATFADEVQKTQLYMALERCAFSMKLQSDVVAILAAFCRGCILDLTQPLFPQAVHVVFHMPRDAAVHRKQRGATGSINPSLMQIPSSMLPFWMSFMARASDPVAWSFEHEDYPVQKYFSATTLGSGGTALAAFSHAANVILYNVQTVDRSASRAFVLLKQILQSSDIVATCTLPVSFHAVDVFLDIAFRPPDKTKRVTDAVWVDDGSSVMDDDGNVVTQVSLEDDDFVMVDIEVPQSDRAASVSPQHGGENKQQQPVPDDDEEVDIDEVEIEAEMRPSISSEVAALRRAIDLPKTVLTELAWSHVRNVARWTILNANQQKKLPGTSIQMYAAALALHYFLHSYNPEMESPTWKLWYTTKMCTEWLQALGDVFADMSGNDAAKEHRSTVIKNALSLTEYLVDTCYATGAPVELHVFLPTMLNVLNHFPQSHVQDTARMVAHIQRYVLFLVSPTYTSEDPKSMFSVLEMMTSVRSLLWHSVCTDVNFVKSISYRLFSMYHPLSKLIDNTAVDPSISPRRHAGQAISRLLKVWQDLLAFASRDPVLLDKCFSTTLLRGAGRKIDMYKGKMQTLLEEESEENRLVWLQGQMARPKDEDSLSYFMQRGPRRTCLQQHSSEILKHGRHLAPATQSYRAKHITAHLGYVAQVVRLTASLDASIDLDGVSTITLNYDASCYSECSMATTTLLAPAMKKTDCNRTVLMECNSTNQLDDVSSVWCPLKVGSTAWKYIPDVSRSVTSVNSLVTPNLTVSDTATSGNALTPLARLIVQQLIAPETSLLYIANCYRVFGVDPVAGIVLLTPTRLIVMSGGSLTETGEIHFAEDVEDERSSGARGNALTTMLSTITSVFQSTRSKNAKQHSALFRKSKFDRAATSNARWEYPAAMIETATHRRYQHFPVAVELKFTFQYRMFLVLLSPGLVMKENERTAFGNVLSSNFPRAHVVSHRSFGTELRPLTRFWQLGIMSTYDYLSAVNDIAGRTLCDLNQYPVFPWTLCNFGGSTQNTISLDDASQYRDLRKPMGALDPERAQQFRSRYESFSETSDPLHPSMPPFHFGSHYSSSAIVMFFNVRLQPFTSFSALYQGGHLDIADRLFHDMYETWKNCSSRSSADVKELIPEFYSRGFFLKNVNNTDLGTRADDIQMGDVVLPAWARNDVDRFVLTLRAALEHDIVSTQVASWVDLVFGYKQRGEEAEANLNTFHYLTYEHHVEKAMSVAKTDEDRNAIVLQIDNFGQTPRRVFAEPHPTRPAHLSADVFASLFKSLVDLEGKNIAATVIPMCARGPILQFRPNGYPRTMHASPYVAANELTGQPQLHYIVWGDETETVHDNVVDSSGHITSSRALPQTFPCAGQLVAVTCAADGSFMFFALSSGLIYVVVTRVGASPAAAATYGVLSLSIAGTSAGTGGSHRGHNAPTSVLQTVLSGHSAPVERLDFFDDGFVLVSVSTNHQMIVWRVMHTQCYVMCSVDEIDGKPVSVHYDARESWVVVAYPNRIVIYSCEGKKLLVHDFAPAASGPIVCISSGIVGAQRFLFLVREHRVVEAAGIQVNVTDTVMDLETREEGSATTATKRPVQYVLRLEGKVTLRNDDSNKMPFSAVHVTSAIDAATLTIVACRSDASLRKWSLKEQSWK
eukprot:PhM_4_TR7340/c0_g1_i1/m.48938